jgi:hypothetical protein
MINVMMLTLKSLTFLFYVVISLLSHAYGVYISQLIRYARECLWHEKFSQRGHLLTKQFILQGYNESRLKCNFVNSTVALMTLFAITNHSWSIC